MGHEEAITPPNVGPSSSTHDTDKPTPTVETSGPSSLSGNGASESHRTDAPIIIAATVSGVLFLVLVFTVIFFCCRRRRHHMRNDSVVEDKAPMLTIPQGLSRMSFNPAELLNTRRSRLFSPEPQSDHGRRASQATTLLSPLAFAHTRRPPFSPATDRESSATVWPGAPSDSSLGDRRRNSSIWRSASRGSTHSDTLGHNPAASAPNVPPPSQTFAFAGSRPGGDSMMTPIKRKPVALVQSHPESLFSIAELDPPQATHLLSKPSSSAAERENNRYRQPLHCRDSLQVPQTPLLPPHSLQRGSNQTFQNYNQPSFRSQYPQPSFDTPFAQDPLNRSSGSIVGEGRIMPHSPMPPVSPHTRSPRPPLGSTSMNQPPNDQRLSFFPHVHNPPTARSAQLQQHPSTNGGQEPLPRDLHPSPLRQAPVPNNYAAAMAGPRFAPHHRHLPQPSQPSLRSGQSSQPNYSGQHAPPQPLRHHGHTNITARPPVPNQYTHAPPIPPHPDSRDATRDSYYPDTIAETASVWSTSTSSSRRSSFSSSIASSRGDRNPETRSRRRALRLSRKRSKSSVRKRNRRSDPFDLMRRKS